MRQSLWIVSLLDETSAHLKPEKFHPSSSLLNLNSTEENILKVFISENDLNKTYSITMQFNAIFTCTMWNNPRTHYITFTSKYVITFQTIY